MSQSSVCVFCGSRNGNNPKYKQAAAALGQTLAHNNWRLVYGAGDIGLMGAVARATQTHGGTTLGVIPTHLMQDEVAKTDLTQFIVTETMHERKKVMFMNCDAVVVLPGGAGSLEEFFEVLTWRQLGLHEKPMYLLDIDGYWEPLTTLMTHIVAQGFADQSLVDCIQSIETVALLETHLKADLNV
jgi:uncharacterized protein (TIGR00730 family)